MELIRCNSCKIEKDESKFEKTKYGHRHTCLKCRIHVKEVNSVKNLTRRYIIHLLRSQNLPFTPEMIEIKKQLIVLKRTINKIEKESRVE